MTIRIIFFRLNLIAIGVCLALHVQAQKNDHLPGEQDTELAKDGFLCRPGVPNKSRGKGLVIQYGYQGSRDYTALGRNVDNFTPTTIDYSETFLAKVKIPIVNAPSFKMLAGFGYAQEKFNFSEFGGTDPAVYRSLDGKTLKGTNISLYLSKSFDEKYYGALRVRSSYDGDFDGLIDFSDRYTSYSALGLFGVKPTEDTEWGVGLSYSHNAIRTRVLPFMIYNRTFNDQWGLEFVLPVQFYGRYNFSENNMILFGADYNSDSYSADLRNGPEQDVSRYFIRHNAVNLNISWEKHLFSWIWFNAQGGYQIPIRSEFRNLELDDRTFRARQGRSPYLKVGIFLSPSKDCIK